MFYEEKVVVGKIYSRSSPSGEWRPATVAHAAAVRELLALTDDQRVEAFLLFCRSCGAQDPGCQCWNDE